MMENFSLKLHINRFKHLKEIFKLEPLSNVYDYVSKFISES